VGKVAISDNILKKPGRFTPEEFAVMKMHTVYGAKLFPDLYSELD
jgi:HD-GYP domain-containing protein (c-di-GMP phosphodiesterase class II)